MPINTFREDETTKEVIKIHTIKRLFRYMINYKKEVISVLLLMSIIVSVNIINPILIKIAIDNYIAFDNYNGLIRIGILAIIINLISMVCIKRRIIIMSKVSNEILLTIRQELYTHIQKLAFNFFDSRPVGKILARIIGDVNSLKDILNNSVITLIPDFITIIAVAIIMLLMNFRLALAALSMLPFLIFIMNYIQIKAHKRWQDFRNKNSNMNAFTHEDFSGMRVVQSFAAEGQTSDTFEKLLQEHKKSFISAFKLSNIFWPIVEVSWGVGTVLVFYFGVRLLGTGTITVGLLVAFTSYISMFWHPIMNLSNFYNQLITNLAGAERIFEIMDIEPDIKDVDEAKEMEQISGKVQFKKVSFEYEKNIKVLDDVSFTIEPGEAIALVGPTGAGKTTIINLISRFYDIQKGDILIDDVNIKEVTIESLRSQMGIMTQDTVLFSGTIKDNIRYGKLDATDEEIIQAAKSVYAHEFIENLEQGYDTEINERGVRLSVGQRQLIAFARTIISNPRILILDEATSSIDTKTERLVQKGIEALLEGRTSFVIAHRLSTIQKANRIFVVADGKIIEEGTHRKLLEIKGLYYNLYKAQV
ncbi:ATP-binding cassette subfamily B protein [Natranaerovirga pectinivora]|uniref:ATP-binding cassette subfamily B protein n=1 Tax=Natranaerovirga pectinivora TaxID=682400 RepID=A0A4R3MIC7_9FIRM|nr:ABC transporter ATP-binding protein [Natranaerovirga pectinivora]TCT13074.1 ATP-binding cassette subfamily B protein [Natranaerovirga pectinivora]